MAHITVSHMITLDSKVIVCDTVMCAFFRERILDGRCRTNSGCVYIKYRSPHTVAPSSSLYYRLMIRHRVLIQTPIWPSPLLNTVKGPTTITMETGIIERLQLSAFNATQCSSKSSNLSKPHKAWMRKDASNPKII